MNIKLVFTIAIILFAPYAFCQDSSGDHDPQLMQIYFKFGLNELDTFHNTYQKDLVSAGTVKTGMWFTTREQEIILTQLNRIIFFNLPDTIHAQPNVVISPSHGPQTLRVKYKGMDKTVVWYYPLPEDVVNNFDYRLESTRDLLWDIIESKPEYKALPPVKGGYQ
jgi:hypothetical protein